MILACLVVLPAATYFLSSSATKTYESSATLQVQAQSVDTSLFSINSTPPEQSLAAAARLIQTSGVAQEAAKQLRPRPQDPRALLGQIRVDPDENAGFITITASDSNGRRAADVANAFARAVVVTRSRRARSQIDSAIRELRKDLQQLPFSDIDGRRQLSQQLQRLRALRAAQGNNAQIVEPAVASGAPVSPKPRRNTALAVILALLLGLGLALLLERLDRRVRDPLELEELTGAPLLGSVPYAAFPGEESTPEVSEAFQTLRASLTYFNINQPLKSVLITSPIKGEGKTTVATNLAMAVARGGKNVILVDTDLRHPQVDDRFGSHAKAGLGAVLLGEAELDDVAGEVQVRSGRLRLLPGGPSPPNPSELLASQQMSRLLAQLAETHDLVIIDTPPALVVSDPIPLLKQVSGIVIIGRVGYTTKDSLARLVHVISNASGSLLGVIATGSRSSGLYGYGSTYGGYGTSPNGAAKVPAGRLEGAPESAPPQS